MPRILVDGVVPGAACFCGDGPSATADRDSSFPQCTGFLDIYSCKIVQLTQIFPGSSRGQESTQVALRSFSLEIEIHVHFLVIESGSYFLENVHRNQISLRFSKRLSVFVLFTSCRLIGLGSRSTNKNKSYIWHISWCKQCSHEHRSPTKDH